MGCFDILVPIFEIFSVDCSVLSQLSGKYKEFRRIPETPRRSARITSKQSIGPSLFANTYYVHTDGRQAGRQADFKISGTGQPNPNRAINKNWDIIFSSNSDFSFILCFTYCLGAGSSNQLSLLSLLCNQASNKLQLKIVVSFLKNSTEETWTKRDEIIPLPNLLQNSCIGHEMIFPL